jgi:DNA-binding response OmpR family regulator
MPHKILVVDDDADMRQILRRALESLGKISESADGAGALRKIKAQRPKLALLDVSMPKMSGIAVLRAARAIDPNILVVMLTSECDLAVAKKALELGARTYITKPFDIDVVFAEIERLLEESADGSAAAPYRPWRVAR